MYRRKIIERYADDMNTDVLKNDTNTPCYPLFVLEQAASHEFKRCQELRKLLQFHIAQAKHVYPRKRRFDTDAFFARWCITQRVLEESKTQYDGLCASSRMCFHWATMLPTSVFHATCTQNSLFEDELFNLGFQKYQYMRIRKILDRHIMNTIININSILSESQLVSQEKMIHSQIDFVFTRHGNILLQHKHEKLSFRLSYDVYNKLRDMFNKNVPDMSNDTTIFHSRLYILLARYATLDGEGYQGTMNKCMMSHLQLSLGAHTECFSSPLNVDVNTRHFCSAFPLVDCVFGSNGSFFTQNEENFLQGTYEVNPPFIEEIMYAMVVKITSVIIKAHTSTPLRFCIFLPQWDDTPSVEYLRYLEKENDSVVYASYLLTKDHYAYLAGFHYLPERNNHHISYAATHVFILQNEAMTHAWMNKFDHDPEKAFLAMKKIVLKF